MIAVLAEPWDNEYKQEGDTLYINMVMRGRDAHLVDFDLLEIRKAPGVELNDELGHILMRSGNEPYMNQAKLKTLPVHLVDDPELNQNSLNLMNMRFREVVKVSN